MSIDILQERIRKTKNPAIISLELPKTALPAGGVAQVRAEYAFALLESLVKAVPAVKVSFLDYAPYPQGTDCLQAVLQKAKELGYYVILDGLCGGSPDSLAELAELVGHGAPLPCDAVILHPYFGTDALKPFLPAIKKKELAVFLWARSPNRSAAELQDLLTGSRLVHCAVADLVGRLNAGTMGKLGFGQIGLIAAANQAGSLQTLRQKYRDVFLLVEGIDMSGGNAKNCSYAFDQFGHGAACCTGSVYDPAAEGSPAQCAAEAADRIQRNVKRYISIL